MTSPEPAGSFVIVVMGVSGSGKTTVGRLLAEGLGAHFADADDEHSPGSIERMRRGEPLEEADRQPWLLRLRGRIAGWLARERRAVLACSALTRASRELLRVDPQRVRFVHLSGERELLRERLEERRGHFAAAELLDSQLATLEPPGPEEALVVGIAGRPEEIAAEIGSRLGRAAGGG